MGFGLCHRKPTSVAESKTASRVGQPEPETVPAKSTTSDSSFKILPLVEACDEVGVCQPAPATFSPISTKGAGEVSFSVSRTSPEGCDTPLWAPGTRVFTGRDDSKQPSSLSDMGAEATDPTSTFTFGRGPDATNGTRTCPSAAPTGAARPFSPQDRSVANPDSFGGAEATAAARGVINRTCSVSGHAGVCRLNSILLPNSRWTDSYSPPTENLPLSMEHRSLSMCSGPPTTLTPCRGSVRFLSSDERDAESTEMALYGSIRQGVDEPKETSSGGRAFAGTPTAQASRWHAPHSLVAENAGADSESSKKNVDVTLCSSAPTESSVSRETPSPWPSVDDPALGPSHHNGVFDSLMPFRFGDNTDQFGVLYGEGGSGEVPPVAGLPAMPLGALQSRRSILMKPSANTSGVGGSSAPQSAYTPLWQDPKAVEPRRASRRWQSEQEGFLSDRRPSFTSTVPRRSSSFRQHRLSRSEDSIGDDEHIVASVRWATIRLQRSNGVGSKRRSVLGRQESRLSSADIKARALRTAAKIVDTMFPALSATATTETSLPISSPTTSESGRARAGGRAQGSELDPREARPSSQ